MDLIAKSKLTIIQDYLRKEIHDIFEYSPFHSIKDNVIFQDEYPDDESPDSVQAFILVGINQMNNQIKDYYNYGLTFSFIYNGISDLKQVAGMEDYFDEQFVERLKNQNIQGIWFNEPIKVGLDKTDLGINTKTVLTSSYTVKAFFK